MNSASTYDRVFPFPPFHPLSHCRYSFYLSRSHNHQLHVITLDKLLSIRSIKNRKKILLYLNFFSNTLTFLGGFVSAYVICLHFEDLLLTSLARQIYWQQILCACESIFFFTFFLNLKT